MAPLQAPRRCIPLRLIRRLHVAGDPAFASLAAPCLRSPAPPLVPRSRLRSGCCTGTSLNALLPECLQAAGGRSAIRRTGRTGVNQENSFAELLRGACPRASRPNTVPVEGAHAVTYMPNLGLGAAILQSWAPGVRPRCPA